MGINFFIEEVDFLMKRQSKVSAWILSILTRDGFEAGDINYIFCTDPYLFEINKKYLGHQYYTDIVTFDHSESENHIAGDLFISIDRIKDNSIQMNIPFEDELHRVMIHGILHLMGYGDKSEKEIKEIRKREDDCLSLRSF